MAKTIAGVVAISVLLAGCQHLTVREGVLSTNQRVAMVSSPGDGVSPPTNLVLYEATPGQFVPVSTGYAAAPVTAVIAGVGGAATSAFGNYHAARALRPSVTNVNSSANADSDSNAKAEGGSDTVVGDTTTTTTTTNIGQQIAQTNNNQIEQNCTAVGGTTGVCVNDAAVGQANDAIQVQ